jgi:hypothetical protein
MKRQILGAMAVSAIALCLSFAAEAKTLVYCSEGSRRIQSVINTTGTSFTPPIRCQQARDFQPGTTVIRASPNPGRLDDGTTYTFHLRRETTAQ